MSPVFWWILVLLLAGALWFAFRASGVAPKLVLVVGVPILLVLILLLLDSPSPRSSSTGNWTKPEEGSTMDLSGRLTDLNGAEVSLESYSGRVLFLNVWATWCGPCRLEMPSMAALYREFSDDGLAMVAVSNEDLTTVREYAAAQRFPFTILTDPDNILARRFGIRAIPTTFILDKQGQLVYQHVGFNDWNSASVRDQIRELLAHE